MPTIRRSIDQNRAKYAWSYARAGDNARDKFKSHVREFPMLVLTCGLVNAVAFAYEKGKISGNEEEGDKGWKILYNCLADWLHSDSNQHIHAFERRQLLEGLLNIGVQDSSKLRALTIETIALFTWIKRFVS